VSLFSRYVEFIDFARGAAHWRYARGNRVVTYQGVDYQPAAIQRGRISESADLTRNILDLTFPQDLGVLSNFMGVAPSQPMSVMLLRQKISDGSTNVVWSGTVGGVVWGTHDVKMHCLPPMASMQALALKRAWQVACPHVLYGAGDGMCNASRSAVQITATLTSVSGNVVHAAAFAAQPNGYWAGGYIEWQADGVTERRFITDHTADAVTLLTPARADVGTVVTALPGCDHTLATCASKFTSTNPADTNGNSGNYGGQPWIPGKNPFGGDSIY
jgi:uncharacterized phage protein (TIGR02218 family)